MDDKEVINNIETEEITSDQAALINKGRLPAYLTDLFQGFSVESLAICLKTPLVQLTLKK